MKIQVAQKVMSVNDKYAFANKNYLDRAGVFCINLLGSPGCGKTSFLEAIAPRLRGELNFAVIEGDLATSRDSERIKALGVPAIQINTGGGCHLDAKMVGKALNGFALDELDFLFIENVGNLVCPANFQLGESLRIAILSTAEGDDKVAKYPVMFQQVDAAVINKMDLIGYLDYELERVLTDLRTISKDLINFKISAKSGEGLEELVGWLKDKFGRFKDKMDY